MNNLIYIQSDGDKINNNSLESLAAMQKFSKSNNENLYAVTFKSRTGAKFHPEYK